MPPHIHAGPGAIALSTKTSKSARLQKNDPRPFFDLLGLPMELRNMVYPLLASSTKLMLKDFKWAAIDTLGLLHSCVQLKEEYGNILYTRATVLVHVLDFDFESAIGKNFSRLAQRHPGLFKNPDIRLQFFFISPHKTGYDSDLWKLATWSGKEKLTQLLGGNPTEPVRNLASMFGSTRFHYDFHHDDEYVDAIVHKPFANVVTSSSDLYLVSRCEKLDEEVEELSDEGFLWADEFQAIYDAMVARKLKLEAQG